MNGFLIFLIILLLIYCSISWILPKVSSFLFERKFNIVLSIGRIGIPYLKLLDVNISKKGFKIHIEEISIQSSFLNSEITKLVTLVVKDVRINKDICDENERFDSFQQQTIDFRGKKIPHFITTFAQFMAVHIYDISAMFLHPESPGWLIHATASELHLDGSIVQNSKTLLVNANLSEASAKILKHAEKNIGDKTCLGELSFAIALEATLVAQGPLSFESLAIGMSHTRALINEGFYLLAQVKSKSNSTKYYNHDKDLLNKILPIIPKNLNIKIEDTALRSVKENSRTDFNSTLQVFQLNSRYFNINNEKRENYSPHVFLSFHLCNLQIQNIREKILMLQLFKWDSKYENNIINFKLYLDTLMLTYNHDTIHKWIFTNFMNNKDCFAISKDPLNSVAESKKLTFLETFMKDCIINGCAEFCQISALTILNGNNSSVGFTRSTVILEQSSEIRNSFYEGYLFNLLFAKRHWHTEIVVESLWWSFNDWTEPPSVSKKMHVWGTPLFLGMALIKIGTPNQYQTRFDILLDTLKLEWSIDLGDYILLAIRCLQEYNLLSSIDKSPRNNKSCDVIVDLKLTHVNMFILSSNEEYIVLRLNVLQFQQNNKLINMLTNGFKVTTAKSQNFYSCISTEDIQQYKAFVTKMQLDVINDGKGIDVTLKLLEEIIVYWCTNIHLKILTFLREVDDFITGLKEVNIFKSRNLNTKKMYYYNIHVFGLFNFNIKISNKHFVKIGLDDLHFGDGKSIVGLTNNTLVISINGADIFKIDGVELFKINNHPGIREEREDYEQFTLSWNNTWNLTINSLKACFPYEHDYADAIQSDFVSVFKWLRTVHNTKKMPFTENSPLPSDFLINVHEFLFEMSDDPFEVKLRDNFVLLLDEYNENLKRQKKLKEKLDQLCKTNLHLQAGKVEELFSNLSRKSAEIYVQRSQKMYKTVPPRTRLFAWTITNMNLMILADPSIHGTNNVIRIMREIDAESPWPEEGLEFSTLWCRAISLRCEEWKYLLKDFPQPLLDIRQCYISGLLVGAEQLAPRRAKRDVIVELGSPWESVTIERTMLPLKFYHDFNCEIAYYSYAFGPCWEPVIAQCNLSFEKIFAPSRDPSPPLPFWDKMRLLLHGRLTMVVQQLTVLLHASLDPYNTTEEMELTWNQVIMDWTNAKFVFKGDLNIFVRTASKYDDCQLLHLPNLKLIVNIKWVSLGDPNDHHNVIQCAPDKVPEYSSNQVHDSFRAFRSHNVNLSIVLETKPVQNQSPTNLDSPTLLLYGSTLRWFENLKLILSGVTRPTRRGSIFGNVRPRKIQLSRHYKKIHLLMGLHKFQVCYWMSFAMQKGCELLGGRLSTSSEHMLSLVPIDDDLKHRPKAEWSIMYMTSELNDSEIWLKSALQGDSDKETVAFRQPVEKCYCLSVAKVSYGREAIVTNRDHSSSERNKDTPTHRLVVYDLKGAWTKSNRNVAFALFDTFMKNKQMKKNLSTESLKSFRKDSNTTPLKRRNAEAPGTSPNASTIQVLQTTTGVQDTPSPLSKIQSGHAANMLQQLIAEAENKAVVFSDDLSSATRQQHLQGLQACQEDDVQHKNWLIALVNAQVLLKGCETKGYVILSAAKAEILQRIHRPVWKDRTLVSKTTWVGTLECLQYYATVNADDNDSLDENIMWLTVDNIQEKESTVISEIPQLPNMVGSGVSVGAVVSDTVGAASVGENAPLQLQRIVSRCKCEFFYACYGDISVDLGAVAEVPPPPQEDVGPWDRRQTAVDAFTLMHHDLDVCTNSLQYAMLLDVVNNLLLYVDPHKKEALERLARMRFKIQLHSVEDQRRPIQVLQTQVRSTMSKLRRLEKETYFISKAYAEDQNDIELGQELERLEKLVYDCKNQLNAQSEELDMMLSCYKEKQLLTTSRLATTRNDKPLTVVRAYEICFKHAQWRLTEADGQIGIADLVLSNFLYTKNSRSDDSVEHLLELGYLRMTNLLPNQIYKEVLCPTEIQSNMPVEHKRVVRIFCREKPPVGGISVKEHFEINVVPLTIGLTKKFYNTMLKFCFPERDPENIDTERGEEIDENTKGKKNRNSGNKRNRDSNFYVHIDDVEKMKERAEKNKLFIYIKIPEVPVRLSYKGNKEKNLEDIRDFSLVIPTLEYHNVTWTWLDLLMAIRSDSRKVILSQAIKQKLQFKRNIGSLDESSSPHEEDKARMLFGNRLTNESKSNKKGVGGILKFSK